MRVLAVTANKGGVGKSTLAFQVAAELARRGLRVLAVDADKQADLTRYARGPRLAGMGLDAVLADPPASLDPRPYIGSVSDNLDLLGSSPRLADADLVLQSAEGGPFLIQRCLAVVAGAYDWAVIDTGHSEPVIAAVLVAADQLLMPTTASSPDARHAGDMLQTAVRVREELGLETGDLLQRSLITIWRRQHNGVADAEVIENLQRRFGDLVCPVIIPHSSRISEANDQRLTVREHAEMFGTARDRPLRAAVDAYEAITDHLLARAGETAGDASGLRLLEEIDGEEPDLAQVASAIRRLKSRRGLDDDELAEVLGRSVDWVRHTLAFGTRHPEGEDRLTIRPSTPLRGPGAGRLAASAVASLSGAEAPRFVRDRLTWLGYISISTYAFYVYALGPVVAFLRQELHLTYTLTSLHATLWSVGSVLAGLSLHRLARRLGRRRLFWLAAVTTAVGALLFIAGHAVEVTLPAVLILGTGSTLVGAVSSVFLADRHGQQRDRALVEANLGASGVGAFVPALLGVLALTVGGWRSALVLPLLVLGALFLFLGRVPMPRPPVAVLTVGRMPRAFWAPCLLVALAVGIEFCVLFYAVPLLGIGARLSTADAAAALSLFVAGEFAGRLAGAWLTRGRGARPSFSSASPWGSPLPGSSCSGSAGSSPSRSWASSSPASASATSTR
jgi:cellulose biosynthesis protein BcsQ/MFS family permease